MTNDLHTMSNGGLDLDAYVESIRVDGFCIIPDVLPSALCPGLRDRLASLAEQMAEEASRTKGIFAVPGVINYEQSFAEYLADDRILTVSRSLLGPHPRISFTTIQQSVPHKKRTEWHADWPFNQNNVGHVVVPYPDQIMHLTMLVMVSPFTEANGGTLIVPGSHRASSNPTDPSLNIDPLAPQETEFHVTGEAGSVVLFDSRLWHCAPDNPSDEARMAIAVRYAPSWLNLDLLDADSEFQKQVLEATGKNAKSVPRIPSSVYETLPEKVKPLYRHWVARRGGSVCNRRGLADELKGQPL